MRIGVIGAGAVGGAIAVLLAQAGHTVEVTARGDHLAAIRERGLALSGAWGEFTALVSANELLTLDCELVVVATKAKDAPAAIRDNVRLLAGVPLVVIQNGLDGISGARQASPESDVIGGLATFATSFLEPGRITVTTAGLLYLGVDAGDDERTAHTAASILHQAVPTSVVLNFVGAQWTKLVINQVNALPAITGLSVQEVIADRVLRKILTASMRESVRVASALGVRFEKLQGMSHALLRLFATVPPWIAQGLPLAISVRIGRTPNPGSTLQSIRRGQETEIDYLNGAVVAAALSAERDVPVNETLVDLVHDVEHSGEFFTREQVWNRVDRATGTPKRHDSSRRAPGVER